MMANWSLGVPHFQTNLHLIRLLMTGGSLVSFATMCWENRNCNWNNRDSVFLRFWKYMMNSFVDFISLCLRRAALFKVKAQILERTFQWKCQWCLLESRCLWCREHEILENCLSEKGLTMANRKISCFIMFISCLYNLYHCSYHIFRTATPPMPRWFCGTWRGPWFTPRQWIHQIQTFHDIWMIFGWYFDVQILLGWICWIYLGLSRHLGLFPVSFFLSRGTQLDAMDGRELVKWRWSVEGWQSQMKFPAFGSADPFHVSKPPIIELDDGKIYRNPLYLMVKTMVSCKFSLKPIQWSHWWVSWKCLTSFWWLSAGSAWEKIRTLPPLVRTTRRPSRRCRHPKSMGILSGKDAARVAKVPRLWIFNDVQQPTMGWVVGTILPKGPVAFFTVQG